MLCKMSWPALQSLDAGSWFGSKFAGERVPSLSQVPASSLAVADGAAGV